MSMDRSRKKRPGRYGKVYSDLLSDEKLLSLMQRRAAGKAAFGVHALALAWQALHLKDGFISPHVLEGALYGTRADADALVKCELWTEVPGGWCIHGYSEANLTKADVAARSLQGRIDACKRYLADGKPCGCGHHTPMGDLVGDPLGDLAARGWVTHAEPEPEPEPDTSSGPEHRHIHSHTAK